MSPRRATIADVARVAGVSASTASVVYSGKTPVSDATRRRVLDAAESLGYTGPDPRAASLRRGRSGIVGVVFEEHLGTAFLDPVKTLMMDGLAEAVAPIGAGLLLLRNDPSTGSGTGVSSSGTGVSSSGTGVPSSGTGATSAGTGPTSAGPIGREPTLRSAPIDAAVLVGCSPQLRESLDTVIRRGIPVVVLEGDAGAGIPRIDLDNREAQRRLARHLRDLGHERVALLTLPTDAARERGWITPEREARGTVDVTRVRMAAARDVYSGAPAYSAATSSIDEGLAAGRVIVADAATRPTAVLAQSDLLAAGVLRAALEAGLRVPEDVSITGFDGIAVDGMAPYELTTMAQPAADKGRAAGDAVAAMLAGEDAASVTFTCEFRRGNTTAAAPSPPVVE